MEGVTFRLGDRLALPWEEPRLDEEGERISRDNWQAVNVLSQIWSSCRLCYALFGFCGEPGYR